MNVNLL